MKKIIFIFDDDEQTVELLKIKLEESYFAVQTSSNYQEALELLNSTACDMIIMNINLNNQEGLELYNYLRTNKVTSSLPIILLTSEQDDFDNISNNENFALEVLHKPVNTDLLISLIKDYFKRMSIIARKYEEKMENLRNNISQALPHEFRTSLSGILGCSEMIVKLTKNNNNINQINLKSINEYANSISDLGRSLYRLTENFLLYSQIQTIMGSCTQIAELQAKSLHNPGEIINELITSLSEEIDYAYNFNSYLENDFVQISYYYFYKMLYELLDNAIKFSPSGSAITVKSQTKNNNYLIEVTDSGRGMTKEQVENIGAYKQFNRNLYEQQGTGLGLIIAKLITLIHNGTFELKSELEKGTSVIIKLPLAKNKNGNAINKYDFEYELNTFGYIN